MHPHRAAATTELPNVKRAASVPGKTSPVPTVQLVFTRFAGTAVEITPSVPRSATTAPQLATLHQSGYTRRAPVVKLVTVLLRV